MTYFEARRAEALFKEYRALALAYRAALTPAPQSPDAWMAGPGGLRPTETEKSLALRQKIFLKQPEVVHWANRLGVDVRGQSFPAPTVGDPVIPFNLLARVVDQNIGHTLVSTNDVLDTIDRCIGAAEFVKGQLLARLVRPWCWLVDVPALIVGWPFVIMRKAGLPAKFVEGTSAQVIKGILTGLIWLSGFAYAVYRTGLGTAIQAVLAK